VNTEDCKETLLEGHQGPILSIALVKQGDALATASCDGTVRLWNPTTKAVLKTLQNVVAKSSDVNNSSSLVGLQFSWDGLRLAVPSGDGLTLLDREEGGSWGEPKTVSLQLAQGELATALCWSPCGGLIMVGTSKGGLHLLSATSMSVIKVGQTGRKAGVGAAVWHPTEDKVAFSDLSGHWGIVEEIKAAEKAQNQDSAAASEDLEDMEALFNDDEEDEENSFSIGKVMAETGYKKDNDGNLTFGATGRPDSALSGASGDSASKPIRVVREIVKEEVKLQAPFQPGASPSGLSSRFLVYNSVGIVRGHYGEEESSIDVEFHDVAVHHALHLANPDTCSMAALSTTVLAFASSEKLTVNYFSSGDVTKDWSMEMKEGEMIEALAVGREWVAITTSTNNLRLLTAGGMQRCVLSLTGPPLTMVGAEDQLMVVTHSSHPLPGQQSLSSSLYTVSPSLSLSLNSNPASLPITPSSELHWVGLTDFLLPATCDTFGVLRIHDKLAGWRPVLDCRGHSKGKSDFHYIVSVSQEEGEARCIVCRGSKYPPTLPRPLPTSLPLLPPLIDSSSERGALEQQASALAIQTRLLASVPRTEEREESAQTLRGQEIAAVMKLFALACRSDHESRAVEVARLLPDVETMQMAIRYAAKQRRVGLADRLGKLAMDLQEKEEKEEEEKLKETAEKEDEESQDMFAPTQENPFLASRELPKAPMLPSQSKEKARNPFAKRTENVSSPSTQGFIFDSVDKCETTPTEEKRGFGERGAIHSKAHSAEKDKPLRKPLVPMKENAKDGELKGVSLYIAEHRAELEAEGGKDKAQETGLARWKGLSAAEKEEYKVARVPRKAEDQKRKRSEEEEDSQDLKKPKSSVKQKLAGFSFGN